MERIPAEALREVEWALLRYEEAVSTAGLAPLVEDIYIRHARHFVHWLKGEFTPGAMPRKRSTWR